MKKLICISIILAFVFKTGGFFLVLKHKQYAIRKEIKRKIKKGVPDSELIPIIVTNKNKSELDWKHSKEFRYKGSMFDIVKSEHNSDGSTTYLCIWDDLESEVFNDLDKLASKEKDNQNRGIIKILKTHHLFIEPSYNIHEPFEVASLNKGKTSYIDTKFKSICIEIDSPPPESWFS